MTAALDRLTGKGFLDKKPYGPPTQYKHGAKTKTVQRYQYHASQANIDAILATITERKPVEDSTEFRSPTQRKAVQNLNEIPFKTERDSVHIVSNSQNNSQNFKVNRDSKQESVVEAFGEDDCFKALDKIKGEDNSHNGLN
jgi:hypothetical protein